MVRLSLAVAVLFVLAAVDNVCGFQSRLTTSSQIKWSGKIQPLPRKSFLGGVAKRSTASTTTTTTTRSKWIVLSESNNDDKTMEKEAQESSFDGQGFANYLAPYALALVASIGVTALFVKFVLLGN